MFRKAPTSITGAVRRALVLTFWRTLLIALAVLLFDMTWGHPSVPLI